MAYYKVKNITNRLPKRHPSKDRILKIDYKDGLSNKQHNLSAGQDMIISCDNIPVNIHMLRMKKLVTVTEISKNQFDRSKKPSVKLKSNTISSSKEAEETVAKVSSTKTTTSSTDSSKSSKRGRKSTKKSTTTTTTESVESTEE